MRYTRNIKFWLGLLPVVTAICFVSCARVQISNAYKGTVVDADTGAPLAGTSILVRVMRVSSFDGASQFARYPYVTNERGEFVLPARKKFVDAMPERIEEMHYYEFIAFGKPGYETREYRSDEENGTFVTSELTGEPIVIRLKNIKSKPAQ